MIAINILDLINIKIIAESESIKFGKLRWKINKKKKTFSDDLLLGFFKNSQLKLA